METDRTRRTSKIAKGRAIVGEMKGRRKSTPQWARGAPIRLLFPGLDASIPRENGCAYRRGSQHIDCAGNDDLSQRIRCDRTAQAEGAQKSSGNDRRALLPMLLISSNIHSRHAGAVDLQRSAHSTSLACQPAGQSAHLAAPLCLASLPLIAFLIVTKSTGRFAPYRSPSRCRLRAPVRRPIFQPAAPAPGATARA